MHTNRITRPEKEKVEAREREREREPILADQVKNGNIQQSVA